MEHDDDMHDKAVDLEGPLCRPSPAHVDHRARDHSSAAALCSTARAAGAQRQRAPIAWGGYLFVGGLTMGDTPKLQS